MGLRLINANELEDMFNYGIDDMAVLGDCQLDDKVLKIIKEQPTIKAVPYYEIARAILQIRSINPRFDYIPRKEVIEILWRLIDGNEISKESLL